MAVASSALYILLRGLDKVRPVGEYLTDYTVYLIKGGFSQSSQEDKDDFFRTLQERGLIVPDADNGWEVAETI